MKSEQDSVESKYNKCVKYASFARRIRYAHPLHKRYVTKGIESSND